MGERMMQKVEKYAPIAIVIIAILFQYNLFVTPERLEQKHRDILSEVSKVYTTKSEFDIIRSQYDDVNKKLDRIYEILTRK
jgi:hypothetical protein